MASGVLAGWWMENGKVLTPFLSLVLLVFVDLFGDVELPDQI